MANELTNITSQSLSVQEQTELDGQIDALIAQHKGNAYEINSLAFNGAMILTATDKHAKEKAVQGFFKRLGKNITGKNNRTQNDINKDLAKAQYIAQKILVKLAEQQQLTFELIAAVHSKLNNVKLEIDRELNDVYGTLVNHDERVGILEQEVSQLSRETADKINGIYGHLLKVDVDIEKLNQNMKLVNWVLTIKNQTYCGIKYSNLDAETKIVCIVRDFFALMQGRLGTINDLNLLEDALERLGLETIIREKFIRQVGTNTRLHTHLLGEDSRLGDFATENEEIICDIRRTRDIEINCGRKFFPETSSKVAVNDFVLELLYNLKQLTLTKELYDRAEKLFLVGNISEALPLLKIFEENNVRARYMLAVIFYEAISVTLNLDYVVSLLSSNISANDICSIFFGARVGLIPKESASDHFHTLTKLADDGDIFAQYELFRYYSEQKNSKQQLKYLQLAADQNYFLAAYELGLKYYSDETYSKARKYFELAAKSKQHGFSLILLGNIYFFGWSITADKKKAGLLYKKAYELGYYFDYSINGIGSSFSNNGKGDNAEALKWWQIGAEKNFPTCLANLGVVYHYGFGVTKNWSEAVKYFEKSIAAGKDDGFCEAHLGEMYYEGGNGIYVNKEKAIEFYKKAYERGTSFDWLIDRIANFYKDVDKNYLEAVKWWRIGAKKNFPTCLANLGWSYRYGHGVSKNWWEAVRYFEQSVAAGKDDGFCEAHLGEMYYEGGKGIYANKKKAVEFYKKAYERGRSYDEMIFKIADFYGDVEQNPSEAIKWWRIGAEKNFPTCLANLGCVYHYGRGVTKNYSEAVEYFERAIAAGSNSGIPENHLGEMYYEGKYGITQDYEKSAIYYEKAIAKGRKLLDGDKENLAYAAYQTGDKYHYKFKDYRRAAEWYKKAYKQDKDCAKEIAMCYEELKMYDQALNWWCPGANKGDSFCAYMAGTYYKSGKGGVGKDYTKALYYFKRNIDLGDKDGSSEWYMAQIFLEGGYGVEADRFTAVGLFWIAANKGNEGAQKWLLDHDEADMFDRIKWAL